MTPSLKSELTFKIDYDNEGYFRVTKNGYFRFSLVTRTEFGEVETKGFRVNQEFTELLLPTAIINGRNPLTIVHTDMRVNQWILESVSEYIGNAPQAIRPPSGG